jgi:hypothetical protein
LVLQQSESVVQAAPKTAHSAPEAHLPASHVPEQHSLFVVQSNPCARQSPATHSLPSQRPEQHCAPTSQAPPFVMQVDPSARVVASAVVASRAAAPS